MGHIWKIESHCEKFVTLRKMGHTIKNCQIYKKLLTLFKNGHAVKTGLHLGKWVPLSIEAFCLRMLRKKYFVSNRWYAPALRVSKMEAKWR